MIVIGLTGSLATGKSTVADLFSKFGAKVLDADKIAHQLMKKNSVCFKEIVRCFGEGILTRGRIDRQKLADVVFKSKKQLKLLEKIIHPPVIKAICKEIALLKKAKKRKAVVLDVPLLFESGLYKITDLNVTVWLSQTEQVARILKTKQLSRKQALARIRCQMPLKQKARKSDYIIDNRGSRAETFYQVKAIWDYCVI